MVSRSTLMTRNKHRTSEGPIAAVGHFGVWAARFAASRFAASRFCVAASRVNVAGGESSLTNKWVVVRVW